MGGKTFNPTAEVKNISLAPHQALSISMAFGVPDEDNPAPEGKYKLRIIPASGKKITVKGRFPVGENEPRRAC